MRIGEVHALLRRDVPDIELSKIRYYEDKGLVEPSRSKKGYRLYSERDVQCLREAIRLAQEEFVPLRVVRLRLIEQGLLKELPVAPALRHAARASVPSVVSIPAPNVTTSSTPAVLRPVPPSTRADVTSIHSSTDEHYATGEFLVLSSLEPAAINHMVSLGLLVPVTVANETAFTGVDLRIAQLAAPLIERGVDVRLLGSLRRVVEREIGILDDLTQPLRAPGTAVPADEAHATERDVAVELAALRSELFQRALSEYLGR
jgi:DNA-binding transcriptional MerR regulator